VEDREAAREAVSVPAVRQRSLVAPFDAMFSGAVTPAVVGQAAVAFPPITAPAVPAVTELKELLAEGRTA